MMFGIRWLKWSFQKARRFVLAAFTNTLNRLGSSRLFFHRAKRFLLSLLRRHLFLVTITFTGSVASIIGLTLIILSPFDNVDHQQTSPSTIVNVVEESPNPLRSGSASYDRTKKSYVSGLCGPRLGTIGCYKDTGNGHQIAREYFLWFEWQIPENSRIESAYFDLSSLQSGSSDTITFRDIGPLNAMLVTHDPALFLGPMYTEVEPSRLVFEVLAMDETVWYPSELSRIDMTSGIRALQRDGQSSVTLHLSFPSVDNEADQRFVILNPKLVIQYLDVP